MLLNKLRNEIAVDNYENNREQAEPSKTINGQGAYSHLKFGCCTLDKVGCGVIAFYNVLRILRKRVCLADLILEMETNGTETIPFGFFGINPFRMKKVFSSYDICWERLFDPCICNEDRKDGAIYLVTFWNDPKNWFRGAHTVAVRDRKDYFEIYNKTNHLKTVAKVSELSQVCGKKALICGYRLFNKK